MTECERIVKSGRLSKDFLREEYRNDFLVDVNRKKLWIRDDFDKLPAYGEDFKYPYFSKRLILILAIVTHH